MLARKLKKWGHSNVLIMPKQIMQLLNLEEDQSFTIEIEDGKIVLTPIEKTEKYDWGEPQGREKDIWLD